MKIYKYASLENALKILSEDKLLLQNPSVFNDPFDSNIKRDKKDIEQVHKIMVAYTSITLLVQFAMQPGVSDAIKKDPRIVFVGKEYQDLIRTLRKSPYFDGNFAYSSLYKLLGLKSSYFKEQSEKNLEKFERVITEDIEKTKKTALVTCFSKRHDSILMWSHYAKSHEGVCIEYDRPEDKAFVDMHYSKKRPKLKLARLVSYTSAMSIIGEDYDSRLNDELINETIKPFITKSSDWKYEDEVRCLITSNSKSDKLDINGDRYYYKMAKPTKIYIGCRAKGKELNDLVKLTKKRNIKFVFFKEDSDSFSLREK